MRGARAAPHDAVAARAAAGAGAVYGLVSGPPVLAARRTSWLAKPAGLDREAFHEKLGGPGPLRLDAPDGARPRAGVRRASDVPIVLPFEARAIEAAPV